MASKRRTQADDDPRDEIVKIAAQLRLTALTHETIGKVLDAAERDATGYSDLALALLRLEADTRKERRLNRNLKRSRLGTVRDDLADFDFAARPKLRARVVRELLHGRWIEEARNVICVGRPGLGKTRVIKALGRAACELGFSVHYVITAELLDELQAAAADGSYKRVFRRYQRIDVLALDELAYGPLDMRAASHLFRLVSARHGSAPTLIAANTGFSQWKTLFPSEAQAVATVDRLIDNATILHFTGKSFRKPKDGSLSDDDAD